MRPLRGCLVADLGVGLIFLDGDDPADEQRYSLAHEVAHFLLHYLQPRQHVLDMLGTGHGGRARSDASADRRRAAFSALRDVVLEPFRHVMARTEDGNPTHFRTRSIEAEADELADELIVPLAELRSRQDLTPERLAADYGLPIWATGRLVAIAGENRVGVW